MNENLQILDYKPKYILIADMVRKQIQSGRFKKGDKLFSDDELALKYKVNARTIAAGLNALVKEGLLERAPGQIPRPNLKTPKLMSNRKPRKTPKTRKTSRKKPKTSPRKKMLKSLK